MKLLEDFKAFAFKGNVLDLAVAVVIGAAFTKIVTTIVQALIMPLVGKVLPGDSWSSWAPGGIQLGLLLAAVIDFLVVALVLFVIVSAIKKAMARPGAPVEPPAPPPEVALLTEIRDLLKQR